ncbi:hypothetical protein FOJ82_00725 [Tessaracoccus rhinocerotis]|uniref:Uncharacterized protein n=1 Tax=Tessaracoccus rhinocerotis TaxID=1689449 RepID=A0A553K454_9ACTN|nr:hypothetical protein [Tessaracoccus rhinocerotis]TRY19468.1 hypothetical protein FOJ82_00725 [Tessaracoccus rhinocerotis]
MDSPIMRTLMATMFTVVLVVVTFIVAGITVGNAIGRLGMVVVLMAAGIGWWAVGQKLFRVDRRR